MTTPGLTTPFIKRGTPVCSYECGDYRAILACDPTSSGPITYPHYLVVFRATDTAAPIMFITAERNGVPRIESSQALNEHIGGEDAVSKPGNSLFLGVLDETGHSTLSESEDWVVLEKFEAKALAVMQDRLKLTASVRVVNDARQKDPPEKPGHLTWIAVSAAIFFIIVGLIQIFS